MIPLKKLIEKEPAANVFSAEGRDYAVDAKEHVVDGKKYAEFDFYKMNVLKLRVFVNREGELKKWSVQDRAERTADINRCLEGYYYGRVSKTYSDKAIKLADKYLGGGDITGELDNLNARRRNKALFRKATKETSLKNLYFSQIPEFKVTDELIARIRRHVISERFLFKWNEKFRDPITNLPFNESLGFCTCCGATMRLMRGYYRHNDKIVCEECGASVTVKDIKRSHISLIRSGCFQAIRKLSDDCVMLSTFICQVDYTGLEYGRVYLPEVRVWEGTRHVFDAGRGIYRRYESGPVGWIRRDNFDNNESYDYGMVNNACRWNPPCEEKIYNGIWLFLDSSERALKETCLKYIDWTKVLSRAFEVERHGDAINMKGLGLWLAIRNYLKYPIYEMLAKVGSYKMFRSTPELFESKGIDLSKKGFSEVFGISPKRCKVLFSADLALDAFLEGIKLIEAHPETDEALIRVLAPFLNRGDDNYKKLKHLSLLSKKAAQYNYDVQIYRDYINDCVRLGLDLSDKYVEFPKDVNAAHERTQVQLELKRDPGIDDKIKKRAKELKKYEFERDGLIIRPAQNFSDLFLEGKMQNNCVARNYAKSYAEGRCGSFLSGRKRLRTSPI